MRSLNGVGTTVYGRAKKQDLGGNERLEAEQAGFLPYSYQVVKWFIVLFMPVIPLGTYRVVKKQQGFWTMEFSSYWMVQVPWDSGQILRHYLIAYSWIIILIALVAINS